jgi:hypothetical protein
MSKSFPSRSQSRLNAASASTDNWGQNIPTNRQGNLFDRTTEVISGSLNDASIVRSALVDAIRKCGKSREALAEEMSRLTGTEVTVRRLNAFTAESREDYRFPAELARAFCAATGSYALLRNLIEMAGFRVVTETEFELFRLGREYLRQKRANDNVAMIEKRLAGVELS